jgi:hypothetical protein
MEETDPQEAAEEVPHIYGASAAPGDSEGKQREDRDTIGIIDVGAVMDEQRIESAKDPAITAVDVLCGRGKLSFNHGKSIHLPP